MGKTETLEKEILQVMDDYWSSYLSGDLDRWANYLPEDYRNIGTNKEEEWNSKKEIIDYTKKTFSNAVGKAELRNKEAQVIQYPPYFMVHELGDIYIKVEDEWTYYARLRLSSLLEQTEGGWKVLHQHGSYPDSKSGEGEAFGFDELKIENKKLQDVIKSRTIELEQQKRELEIDAALERIRSQSLQMQHSSELDETSRIFHEQLLSLGIFSEISYVWLPDVENQKHKFWASWTESKRKSKKTLSHSVTYDLDMEEPHTKMCFEVWQSDEKYHIVHITPKELKGFFKSWKEILGEAENLNSKNFPEGIYYAEAYMIYGCFGININRPLKKDEEGILGRFALEFQRTYTRFLDLQKAETQAREAQIEAGLERLRSASMAMHKSEQLHDVVNVLYKELQPLTEDFDIVNIMLNIKPKGLHFWNGLGEKVYDDLYHIPYSDLPLIKAITQAWRRKEGFIELPHTRKEKDQYFNMAYNYMPVPANRKKMINKAEGMVVMGYFNKNTGINLIRYKTDLFSEVTKNIVTRFSKVFEQTYSRFLDLQKAETQAKEAKIEVALERVRAQALAMHHTSELQGVISKLHNELLQLEMSIDGGSFIAINEDIKDELRLWGAGGTANTSEEVIIPRFEKPFYLNLINKIKNGKGLFAEKYTEGEKQEFFKFLLEHEPWSSLPDKEKQETLSAAGPYIRSTYINKNTSLIIINHLGKPFTEDEHRILERFSKVFEQSYTRFLDLKKAEAQAREAQIEASLERVRSRALAMHSSADLSSAASMVFTELRKLGVNPIRSGVGLFNKGSRKVQLYSAISSKSGDSLSFVGWVQLENHPVLEKIYDSWVEQEDYFPNLRGEQMKKYYQLLLKGLSIPIPDFKKEQTQYGHFIPFSIGCLYAWSDAHFSEDQIKIFRRFASIVDLTFRRFLELKKAEAQAREAQIEMALEKVRSRTMAMHSSLDVGNTMVLLFEELEGLGIKANRNGIILLDDEEHGEIWTAKPNINGVVELISWELDMSLHDLTKQVYRAWKNKYSGSVYPLIGDDLKAYYKVLNKYTDIPVKFNLDTLPKKEWCYTFNFNEGFIYLFIDEKMLQEYEQIPERFASVFGQTYRRYQDLQKAEAQAREAQIETALERIRSRSMAMHKSDELSEVILILFGQLELLNLVIDTCYIDIFDEDNRAFNIWIGAGTAIYPEQVHLPYSNHPIHQLNKKARQNNLDFFSFDEDKKSKDLYFEHFYVKAEGINVPENRKKDIAEGLGISGSAALGEHSGITMWNYRKLKYTREENEILVRVNKVFQQTYTRFLDLKKAEAQAREAQIEAALERVRARSMAMHKSEELLDVIKVVSEQLRELDFRFNHVSFANNDLEKDYKFWVSFKGGPKPIFIKIPFVDIQIFTSLKEAQGKKEPFFTHVLSAEDHKIWHKHLLHHSPPDIFSKVDNDYIMSKGLARSAAINENIILIVANMASIPYSKEQNKIIERFGKVFEQSYTRFLDLQKAESQARESQIEAALERVRSKTMAMHNSEDMESTVITLFEEVSKLGLDDSIRCGIGILEHDPDYMETYSANSAPDGTIDLTNGILNMNVHPMLVEVKNSWKEGKSSFQYEFDSKELREYYSALNNEPDYPFNRNLETMPENEYQKGFFFKEGILFAFAPKPIPEEAGRILKRFASVFGQTYTRFLDLQKAEAQAREAQIEAALERVRSKAMAMRSSEDISEATTILFHEIEKLDIETMRCGIVIINKNKVMDAWTSSTIDSDQVINITGQIDMTIHPLLLNVYDFWEKGESFTQFELKDEVGEAYYEALRKEANYNLPTTFEQRKRHFCFSFNFEEGAIFTFTRNRIPENSISIFERFARVFGLTYQRYRELIESEKREREAKKQASLDRVRGEIASMRSTQDLDRITPIIWSELINLGVPFFRCGVFIMNDEDQNIDVFLSDPNGKSLGLMSLDYYTNDITKESVEAWKRESVYRAHWDKEGFMAWTKTLSDLGKIKTSKEYQGGDDAPESLHLHFVPFSQGMLYVGHLEPLNEDQLALVRNLAKSFSIAYARYEDFTKLEKAKESIETTLTDLKSTQKQLIQSEKMASLGELTAGIAHEIQNPLNFVNNFSEVSSELIDEIAEEMANGDMEEVMAILADIKENLVKINHHGKRADGIVKGMLQHSRTNSGEKELTDINQLADEYFNLAYHGLRAKEKSFNATLKTDFDLQIGKISIVPQEIGRVLLNLINNAFYACTERSRSASERSRSTSTERKNENLSDFQNLTAAGGYKPTVKLKTARRNGAVNITVEDNGSGMPKQVMDKIFQPFFTTKPTGQGTGLGLSMSYDIILAHGGELEVDSTEGEGTKFTITIPNKEN